MFFSETLRDREKTSKFLTLWGNCIRLWNHMSPLGHLTLELKIVHYLLNHKRQTERIFDPCMRVTVNEIITFNNFDFQVILSNTETYWAKMWNFKISILRLFYRWIHTVSFTMRGSSLFSFLQRKKFWGRIF